MEPDQRLQLVMILEWLGVLVQGCLTCLKDLKGLPPHSLLKPIQHLGIAIQVEGLVHKGWTLGNFQSTSQNPPSPLPQAHFPEFNLFHGL